MNPQNGPIVFPFALDVHIGDRPFKLGFNAVIRQFDSKAHFDLLSTDPNTYKGRAWMMLRNGVPAVQGKTGEPTESLVGAPYIKVDADQTLQFKFDSDQHGNSRVLVTISGTAEFGP